LQRVLVLRFFALESLPKALQFEDQRRTLRTRSVAMRLPAPAPRWTSIWPAVFRLHG
jgi:hypothetical protein